MSLLESGTDVVTVTLTKKQKNQRNTYDYVPDLSRSYTHMVNVRAVSMDVAHDDGTQAVSVYKFRVRNWEGGIHSRIYWNGREFDQIGEAKPHLTGSDTMQHVEVRMQARSAEVK